MKKTLLALSLLLLSGCRIASHPHPTIPARAFRVDLSETAAKGTVFLDGADVDVTCVDGSAQPCAIVDGHVDFPALAGDVTAANLHIRADEFQPYDCVIEVPPGDATAAIGNLPMLGNRYRPKGTNGSMCPATLTPLFVVPLPPTREQALGINIHFQGLLCDTPHHGVLHWFDAALAWLDADDRQAIYKCKHDAGDTHVIVGLPTGDPLYNEPDNDFAPDHGFGPLDWTNGLREVDARFADLVLEARQNGFRVLFFSDERQTLSLRIAQLALTALQQSKYGDLSHHVVFMPGWDGIFYGWDPKDIQAWARGMRAQCPDCFLGLEHNPGHIPLGEGGGDFRAGGKMEDFDLVLSEFNFDPGLTHDTLVWQIVGRLVQPYIRPADEVGDGNPPFYLVDSPRGPRFYCAFEWNEYLWVRARVSKEQIDADRAYLHSLGAKYTG